MRYISCFSGIGGLEASTPPELFCEADRAAADVLRLLHPDIQIWPDVRTLVPPKVDVIAGGWPCQDLSIAGKQAGLSGLRSSLLLDMLRIARDAEAETIVAENVTNLLKMRSGKEFSASLAAMQEHGFGYVSWRLLNTREFGLPQNRSRLLIIASKNPRVPGSLFRPLPKLSKSATLAESREKAAGFYWTAGTHSINYSKGYVPTIKIGSGLGIASPPAVHYGRVVRTLSPTESLKLQGFDLNAAMFSNATSAYKAAGNAVARPIGGCVLDGLEAGTDDEPPKWTPTQDSLFDDEFGRTSYPSAGYFTNGIVTAVEVPQKQSATNLIEFLDIDSEQRLSARASKGLLERLSRSGQVCPEELHEILHELAG